MFVQSSVEVPRTAASRGAMLAEMPALQLNTRDKVTRVVHKREAAADKGMYPRYSRRTNPGCGGLCMHSGYSIYRH